MSGVDAVVVAALDWEAACVRASLRDVAPGPAPRTWRGRTAGGATVLVCQAGMGAARAAAAVEAAPPARVLAMVGCAGALVPGLAAGDLVAATAVIRLADGARLPATADTLAAWAERAGVALRCAPHAASDVVLPGGAAKRAAAASGAAVVEMESAAVAAAAVARGVPCVALRVVLDAVDASVPLVDGVVDEATGDVRVLRAVTALAVRPWLWPAMARLGGHRGRAARALRDALGRGGLDAIVGAGLGAGPGVRTPGPAGGIAGRDRG